MLQDAAKLPPTTIRRSDLAVTDEGWIRRFLDQAAFGVLATVHEGQPYLNTNLFLYDEGAHCIYFHNAREGRTPTNIMHNARVCLTVMEMGRLLPADTAMEFGVEYASVVVFGKAHLVDNEDEATHALQMLLNKYAPHLKPGDDYRPPIREEVEQTAVFRIEIDQWSGKKAEEAADFPGAYWYSGQYMLQSLQNK